LFLPGPVGDHRPQLLARHAHPPRRCRFNTVGFQSPMTFCLMAKRQRDNLLTSDLVSSKEQRFAGMGSNSFASFRDGTFDLIPATSAPPPDVSAR
jgi:hypothetical protein